MIYKALHKLTYGLYLVATISEGRKAGFVANTVFQVTSEPPRVAISCHKNNATLALMLQSGIFSVSVLKREANTTLIGEFGFMSGSDFDKFSRVKTITAVTGAPVVTDSCMAWLDCRVVQTLDAGTHMILVGEVVDSGVLSDDEPLTYAWYREKFKMLAPRNAPTYIEKEKLEQEAFSVSSAYTEKGPGRNSVSSSVREEVAKGDPVSSVVPEEETEGATISSAVPGKRPEADPDDDEQYICAVCGYVYRPEDGDPSDGIPPGTPFSDLPEDYRCPICNAGKDYFKPLF